MLTASSRGRIRMAHSDPKIYVWTETGMATRVLHSLSALGLHAIVKGGPVDLIIPNAPHGEDAMGYVLAQVKGRPYVKRASPIRPNRNELYATYRSRVRKNPADCVSTPPNWVACFHNRIV